MLLNSLTFSLHREGSEQKYSSHAGASVPGLNKLMSKEYRERGYWIHMYADPVAQYPHMRGMRDQSHGSSP